MHTIGTFAAKTHFSALIEEVEKGEQVLITKHGRAVARLIPVHNMDKEKIAYTIKLLKAFSQKHSLGELDWKTLRDQGRK
jgi:prevent-host-death family protein